MAKLATGTVLYPAKDNKESQHNPGQRPIKWKLDSGDDARTWHYPSQDLYHLPKGTKAQLIDTGKGWDIVEGTWDQEPQRQDAPAPASTGTGQPAPAATGYSPAVQPLDRVGEPGREEALNEELTVRVLLANRAMQATAKSMALAMKTMEAEGIVFSGPVDFAAIAEPMARIVNTHLMGLTDQRSYFGGSSQNAL